MFNRHGVPRTRLAVLRKVPMFEGLSDKVLARIDSNIDERDVPEGFQLTSEGAPADQAFIVARGVAEVRIGEELVGETSVGEMIGEIGILNRTRRTATVTARTPMRLLVVTPRAVSWLLEDETLNARVKENLERHLGRRQP